MDNKVQRQKAIKSLIHTHRYVDQQSLVEALKIQYGISTTQAVLSRDLKEMGVIKQVGQKGRHYALPEKEVEKEVLRRAVREVLHNGSLIVVHTLPGLAGFVGDVIDASPLDILGSIAGENMLFIAPRDVSCAARLCEELKEYLGGGSDEKN